MNSVSNKAMNLSKLILWFTIFSLFSLVAKAATYTVTNTNDSGSGSLRKAITDANITPGSHIIVFNIPTSDANYITSQGVWKITPSSTLPIIMRSNLVIDGTTQSANQGDTNPYGPEIMLDGNYQPGSDFAFHLYNVNNVTVRGFIIGRFTIGISVTGSSCFNNFIVGNYIGCNYNATDTLSNINGIEIMVAHSNTIGGSTLSDRNIVSGNNHVGIRIANSNNNIIKGNYVGINRTGDAAVRNYDGISIEGTSKYNTVGGYSVADRNYVSGNIAYGIPVFGAGCDYNLIIGNYVGTDITGNISIPNTYGVLFDDGASNNMLGGYQSGAGNLLSGNSGYGVFLYNPGTQRDSVIGNLIGTNAAGTTALPNANGIVVDGPSFNHFIDGNVISGNLQNGIVLHLLGTDNNVMVRNKIGTDISGVFPIGNGFDGVRLGEGPRYNLVGRPGEGNIIAFNGGSGITVMTAAERYNSFTENSIFGNGGIGIDLYPAGVTLNDTGDFDTGPNDLLNYPEIQNVSYNTISGVTTISGIMDFALSGGPAGIKVEIFKSENAQGKEFLGFTSVDAFGNWSFDCAGLLPTDKVTATATDLLGNTSEFYFDSSLVTLVIEEISAYQISIYPNPTSHILNISQLPESFNGEVFIYNTSGKLIFSKKFSGTDFIIETGHLETGIYLIQILDINGEGISKRFIKCP
ncbi:MAG: T9SS type A sorting domain-containing protein [Candidatus Competibacteraceae bacterium]|nr:T9SS type A sorting domain-containing protein [Candidatus Competibacteraceae bacterium]